MNFFEQALDKVKVVPHGKVATYEQIASLVSTPRAARQVGYVLSKVVSGSDVPWHRIINSKSMISIENTSVSKMEQAKLLEKEGIEEELRGGNHWVDLKKYQWRSTE